MTGEQELREALVEAARYRAVIGLTGLWLERLERLAIGNTALAREVRHQAALFRLALAATDQPTQP